MHSDKSIAFKIKDYDCSESICNAFSSSESSMKNCF